MSSAHLPKHLFVRIIRWPFSWLLDRNSDLSTSKIMAFAILGAHVIGKTVPTLLATLLITAAFGYSAWKDFVAKNQWSNTNAMTESLTYSHVDNRNENITKNINENITRTIAERRDNDQAMEPSP